MVAPQSQKTFTYYKLSLSLSLSAVEQMACHFCLFLPTNKATFFLAL